MVYIEVDLDKIVQNACAIKNNTNSELVAVVKANAYGCGINNTVLALSEATKNFAVANAYESSQILRLLPSANVLVLSSEHFNFYDQSATYTVCREEDLDFVYGKVKKVAIKLNTGMNRFGCNPNELEHLICKARKLGFEVSDIYTHFCSLEKANEQFDIFTNAVLPYKNSAKLHCCASNCLDLSNKFYLDKVRCGLAIYGFGHNLVTPAVEVYTEIVKINYVKKGESIGYGNYVAPKNMKIAVLSAGYADGISLSKDLHFSINGKRCKVVNRPCMDATMVDITQLNCKVGDRAYILGDSISMIDAERYNSSFAHQILTAFHTRAIRKYVKK